MITAARNWNARYCRTLAAEDGSLADDLSGCPPLGLDGPSADDCRRRAVGSDLAALSRGDEPDPPFDPMARAAKSTRAPKTGRLGASPWSPAADSGPWLPFPRSAGTLPGVRLADSAGPVVGGRSTPS